MLMVIFGAGASYDSSHYHPVGSRPPEIGMPLAAGLFMDRPKFREAMQKFPLCLHLIPLLTRDGYTVEQLLQELSQEAEKNDRTLRGLITLRYYIQRIITSTQIEWQKEYLRGVNNYKGLLGLIDGWLTQEKEEVCLVTFNYDTLLENALESFGFKIESMAGYVNQKPYRLFKLHGSINWGRETTSGADNYATYMEYVRNIKMTDKYNIITNDLRNIDFMVRGQTTYLRVPAIAVPIEFKNEFEFPRSHFDNLCNVLPTVDKIVTIGWKGVEKHFLALLKQYLPTNVKGLVVSGSQRWAEDTVKNLREAELPDNFLPSGHTFTTFVQYRDIDKFLRDGKI